MTPMDPDGRNSQQQSPSEAADEIRRRLRHQQLDPDQLSIQPQPRRRTSLEDDYFYREVMAFRRPPAEPAPSYRRATENPVVAAVTRNVSSVESPAAPTFPLRDSGDGDPAVGPEVADVLPPYSCDIHMEAVFARKMEIEHTVKRAADRHWQMLYVVLHGTALNVYSIKRDWGWGRTQGQGPGVSADRPPWAKQGPLERSYSLLHADVGIAADYIKRRYVIRIRAETEQFLVSCVELETFILWLDALFAAISVAAPIDDRDFPRDHSIPRIQRLRWFRGQQQHLRNNDNSSSSNNNTSNQASTAAPREQPIMAEFGLRIVVRTTTSPGGEASSSRRTVPTSTIATTMAMTQGTGTSHPPPPGGRLSTTSYPNESVDAETGKWTPRHRWTTKHDLVYAKLCYAVLLFKSPRKSNYIIKQGKQWFVDWNTGRMVRILPPPYDEIHILSPPRFGGGGNVGGDVGGGGFGESPWGFVAVENRRI